MTTAITKRINVGFVIFGLGGFFSAFATFVNLQVDVKYIKEKVDKLTLRTEDIVRHEEQIKQLQQIVIKP